MAGSHIAHRDRRLNYQVEMDMSLSELILGIPGGQLLLVGLSMASYLIGANLVFNLHRRRTGKKGWNILSPFLDMAKFNLKEWVGFSASIIFALIFMLMAIN